MPYLSRIPWELCCVDHTTSCTYANTVLQSEYGIVEAHCLVVTTGE